MKTCARMLLGLAVFGLLAAPEAAQACAACFGKSDSLMAQGMNAGIFTLLAVVGAVLTGAASFFVFLARKAASYRKEEEAASAQPR